MIKMKPSSQDIEKLLEKYGPDVTNRNGNNLLFLALARNNKDDCDAEHGVGVGGASPL